MKRSVDIGAVCAAFGAGLLLSIILPVKLTLILAAAALVVLGLSRINR